MFFRIAEFGIGQLQIPGVQIGRTEWWFLHERPGILKLPDHFDPVRGLNIHLQAGAKKEVGIIVSRLESAVVVTLVAKPFFPSETDPLGQLLIEEAGGGQIR